METKNIVKYKEKIEKLKIDDYAPSIRMSEDEFTEDYLASVRRRINQQHEVHDSRIKKLRGLYYAGEETQNLQISRDMYALVEEDTVEVKSSPIGAMSQKAVDKAFRDLAFDKLYSEVDAMSLCLDKYIEEANGFAQSRVERVTLDEYVVRNYKYISVCEDFVNKLDGYRLNAEQEESLEKLRSKVKALKDASEPIYAGQAETITDVSEERASSVKELDKLIIELEKSGKKPRLLLHSCCAPCSSYCLFYLAKYFDIIDFYYNPNISPKEEHDKRARELERFVKSVNDKYGYIDKNGNEVISFKYDREADLPSFVKETVTFSFCATFSFKSTTYLLFTKS